MRHPILTRMAAGALALTVLVGAAGAVLGASSAKAAKPSVLPVKAQTQTGVTVYANAKASIDASNLADGYLLVKYTGGKNVRIKVLINKQGAPAESAYKYDLNNQGNVEVFPLTEGDGTYTVQVLEHTTGNKYAAAHSATVTMTLRNDFLPFLYSNQYVNYTAESKVVGKAAEIVAAAGAATDLAKIQAVFTWVTTNFTYDYELAKTVQSGYLPDVDKVLDAKKGICFDYAAVMSAMLRSQNIPCKLVVGWSGTIYHAWVNVYIEGVGWVDKVIYFDGTDWTLMDPTFVSSGGHSESIMKYVTTESNYKQKYAY